MRGREQVGTGPDIYVFFSFSNRANSGNKNSWEWELVYFVHVIEFCRVGGEEKKNRLPAKKPRVSIWNKAKIPWYSILNPIELPVPSKRAMDPAIIMEGISRFACYVRCAHIIFCTPPPPPWKSCIRSSPSLMTLLAGIVGENINTLHVRKFDLRIIM